MCWNGRVKQGGGGEKGTREGIWERTEKLGPFEDSKET